MTTNPFASQQLLNSHLLEQITNNLISYRDLLIGDLMTSALTAVDAERNTRHSKRERARLARAYTKKRRGCSSTFLRIQRAVDAVEACQARLRDEGFLHLDAIPATPENEKIKETGRQVAMSYLASEHADMAEKLEARKKAARKSTRAAG